MNNYRPQTWEKPQPLEGGLPAVLPFHPAFLPAELRPWIMDIADRMQCPPDFPAVGALCALASLVGRKCSIRPKAEDDWAVVPNMWGAAVGRPGVMKTPAMLEPLKLLSDMEGIAAEAHADAMKDFEAGKIVAKEAAKVESGKIRKALNNSKNKEAHTIARQFLTDGNEMPPRRRYMTNDPTIEKLGEIFRENPNGILLNRDELIGWFSTLDREGHEADRGFVLECWNGNGGRYTYDRIGRGTIDVPALCLSIVGSIQPGPLAVYITAASAGGKGDDGLIQRFQLAVYPDVAKDWINVDRAPDIAARTRAKAIYTRLGELDPVAIGAKRDDETPIPYLRFDPEAQKLFDEWRSGLEREIRGGQCQPLIEAHLAKYRSLVPKLALLSHLADAGTGPVPVAALTRACAMVEYLRSHMVRIYSPALSPDITAAQALAVKLRSGELASPFTLREIYRHGWAFLNTHDAAQAAVDVMVDHEWLRLMAEETGGRPKITFHVNPRIAELVP